MTTREPDPLQAQLDGIPVPCYTWLADRGDFVLERANRAAFDLARDTLAPLLGARVGDVYPDRPDIAEDLERCLRERQTVRREMEHRLATTGEERRLDVSYVYVPQDRVMVYVDDLTELHATEERLRAVLATLESGLITIDLQGRVTEANPAACTIFGVPEEQLLADPRWWHSLSLRFDDDTPVEPGDPESPGARAVRYGEPVRDVTMLVTRPEGDVVTVSLNYQPLRRRPGGPVQGVVISIVDLTEGRRLHERLVHQALHDPLTGLPNRLLFQERLDVAQPLVRFGGDEFAVLAELSDEREAAELAQRLATALEAPFDAGRDVFVTAAIGIAVEDDRRGGPAELIQGADAAMQRVKARGGAAYEVFDPAMRGRLRDRLQIEDGLHRALANDELRLFYQPIVALEPRAVVAVEALVRWQHPDEGLLAPGRFLPVAEQHGRLISAIGDWVLRRACEDARRWPPGVRVSVNVAARELDEQGFAERVAATIAGAGVAPERIALEITETTLMEGGEGAIAGLEALAGVGVELYLDDFGTGYSSLTRLARLPLTGIKLDRGFVMRAAGERDRRVIEAALSIGRAAELGVTAEGVETEDQLELLRGAGCNVVQGHLLGRPAPPEQVTAGLT
jgi:EAL domain-containing protein (putative c-di-GMP-specific phosphodiesterase class I)/GGDEF domain-containing protein/PAS domain-containing protein